MHQFAITALLVMGREQVVDIFDLKGCDPEHGLAAR